MITALIEIGEELGRVARVACGIAGAQADEAGAPVGRLEQAGRPVQRQTAARARIDDAGVVGIDRQRRGIADREGGLPVEDRPPGRSAVPAAPDTAAGGALIDQVRVVRVDRDRRSQAVVLASGLHDRAGPNRRPDRAADRHLRDLPGASPGGFGPSSSAGTGSDDRRLVDGTLTAPGSLLNCSAARS